LVQLAVIVMVFGYLKGRIENIVVAILGLLYITIRSIAIGQGMALARMALALDKDFARIQELLGDDPGALQERTRSNSKQRCGNGTSSANGYPSTIPGRALSSMGAANGSGRRGRRSTTTSCCASRPARPKAVRKRASSSTCDPMQWWLRS
jgi:hypothetical protein